MIFWGYYDRNNNVIGLQINDGPITIIGNDDSPGPPIKIVINENMYRSIMDGQLSLKLK